MKYCPDCGLELITRVIDELERAVCSEVNCHFIHWNNPIPVVLVLVQIGNEYLLARNSLWAENIFSLISGYVDANENLEHAAIREVYEELGLKAKVVSYIGSYSFKPKNQLLVAYSVLASGEITLNHEIVETKLLSLQDLMKYDFGGFDISQRVVGDWSDISALQ